MIRQCSLRLGVLLMFLVPAAVPAEPPAAFELGVLSAGPGQSVSGYLDVPAADDPGTRIPVSVIHGASPGPVLALIAGTHGYEYPGITALQRLRRQVDPQTLSGTLLLVHIANPPSFYGRTIYVSPVDGKNLNRVYPGNAAGSLSERIALVITAQVIERADYLVDLHAGDGNEALRPYIYMPVTGQPELDAAARGMALAFGLDTIVIDEGRVQPPEASVYTDQTALSRGIPAITTETGQLGSNDDYWVDMAVDGLENLLRHLRMTTGAVRPNEGVVWLNGYQVIPSPATGLFTAVVRDGYAVAENGLLGRLVDPFGEPLAEIRAPFAGVVNYVLGTPPVSEGEPVAMISRLAESPPRGYEE
ncbi:MAG: M14 family metallopeptidase [Xanthomonadales bacterium]|nr:M14 family metallopeptidase [Xanthomonadales bacterium]